MASVAGDPVAGVALGLAVILLAATLAGDLAVRLHQPAVLGELLAGVVLGNLPLLGVHQLAYLAESPFIDMLARLGVLLLLFEVGLESTVRQMLQVGPQAVVVALIGVVAPAGLGFALGVALLPGEGAYVHAFLGATLSATSVGISARVLRDLGRTNSAEARLILGAAVVDDVLALVGLAVVGGAIVAANAGQVLSWGSIAFVLGKAALFLGASLFLGVLLSPPLFGLAARLRSKSVMLAIALAFCFALAWVASLIGLSPIVGAFAAGLVLEDVHFRKFRARGEEPLENLVRPIAAFLVPVFFVVMGMRTDLRACTRPGVLLLAAALTVAAIVGKLLCSVGVLKGGVDRLSVGIGMIPRGEVGLIFANAGAALTMHGRPVIDGDTFSAVVVMVVVTTVLTPPLLKLRLSRAGEQPVPATAPG
jgi:Kef-type K+ transport system membrane component KefB